MTIQTRPGLAIQPLFSSEEAARARTAILSPYLRDAYGSDLAIPLRSVHFDTRSLEHQATGFARQQSTRYLFR